jgi:hypothetical protein
MAYSQILDLHEKNIARTNSLAYFPKESDIVKKIHKIDNCCQYYETFCSIPHVCPK